MINVVYTSIRDFVINIYRILRFAMKVPNGLNGKFTVDCIRLTEHVNKLHLRDLVSGVARTEASSNDYFTKMSATDLLR